MHRRILLLLLSAAVLVAGCGYPKVSPTAYELSMSLYNVSNRKLKDQLPAVEERIAEAKNNEEISEREAKWLEDIVALAAKNRWKKAMQSARRMMEDQVDN